MADDRAFMRGALALARRGLGETAPNPSVGCVIVRDGRVVGRGRTQPGGRPHAEVVALAEAGGAARGATAYVTLEPCAFTGRSPPCTEALIASGIARVVIAAGDPHPKVDGVGIAQLRAAGIEVAAGVLAAEAEEVAAPFLTVQRQSRPLVCLKLASTLDGKIATAARDSQWITGEPARRAAHALRGQYDAIMVGVGTVLADDPALTCRIDGYRTQPLVRLVVDSHLRTPLLSTLVRGAQEDPLVILHRGGADRLRAQGLREAGVELVELPMGGAGVDLEAALKALAGRGITSVLAEGGATLAAALLRAGLVDRLAWFHAPAVMGGDGFPAAQGFGVRALAEMPRFTPVAQARWGDDMLTTYRRAA